MPILSSHLSGIYYIEESGLFMCKTKKKLSDMQQSPVVSFPDKSDF